MMEQHREGLETMEDFFDARSLGYDQHMLGSVADFAGFYGAVARQIHSTALPIEILDLGCGTGLELEGIFQRAPQARVTGIDLSGKMLSQLRQKHAGRLEQLSLIQGSYLDDQLGRDRFDFCVSVMTLHHLLPDRKRGLYSRILDALKPGGVYIEGDYVVSGAKEALGLAAYLDRIDQGPSFEAGRYHLDLPLSRGRQLGLLLDAGFSLTDIVYDGDEAAVFTARK